MANDFVKVPADSVDAAAKKLDASSLTVGANVVYRNRTVIADDTNASAVSKVMSTSPSGGEYGLVVRHSGNLKVSSGNYQSIGSTSTPLTANAVYTSSFDVGYDDMSCVVITVISDVASATGGLSIQWSNNGSQWDITDNYSIPANVGKVFTSGIVAPYFRVVYTNGAVAQGTFRLYIAFHGLPILPTSSPVGDTVTADNDVTLTKAILAARLGGVGGVYTTPDLTTINGLNNLNVVQNQVAKSTYRAIGSRLSFALVAGTAKQYMDLWHANTALKTVKLRRVLLTISANSTASVITADITRISAAPTGGTAVVMGMPDSSDPASTTTSVTLPTSDAAISGGLLAAQSYALGVVVGATDTTKLASFLLYDYQEGGDQKPLTIRSGVTEGFAIRFTGTVATTMVATITLEFTEE